VSPAITRIVGGFTPHSAVDKALLSLLDIAHIGMDGFNSTKTFARTHFLPSAEKYYDDDQQARLFSQIKSNEKRSTPVAR
jgi:hypothetical protein